MNKIIIFKSSFENKNNSDEWTSYLDVGKLYGEKIFSIEDYRHIENQYLNFIKDIISEMKIDTIRIKKLENYNNLKWKNGKIELDEVIKFSKDCLREKCWGILSSKKLKIFFGYDYYLIIETDYDISKLDMIVRNNKLFSKSYHEYLNSRNIDEVTQIEKNKYLGFEIFCESFRLSHKNKTYNISYSFDGCDTINEENCSYYILTSIKQGFFVYKKDEIIYKSKKYEDSLCDFITQFNIKFNSNLHIADMKSINEKTFIKIYCQLFTGKLTCFDIEYKFIDGEYLLRISKNKKIRCKSLQIFIDVVSSFINEFIFKEKDFFIKLIDYIDKCEL